MKILYATIGIVTVLLLIFTLICGLWIKSQSKIEPESLSFHMAIGSASVIFGTISVILLLIQVVKHP